MTWSDQAERILRQHWAEGCTANEVSFELAKAGIHKTRNSIIGKVHRLGLARRMPSPPKKHSKKARATTVPKVKRTYSRPATVVKKPKPLKPTKVKPDDAKRIGPTLMQLERRSCRWPVGKKTGAEQMFCGENSDEGSSYCCEHRKRSVSQIPKAQREALSEGMRKHQKSKRSLKDIIAREAA